MILTTLTFLKNKRKFLDLGFKKKLKFDKSTNLDQRQGLMPLLGTQYLPNNES